MKKINFIFGIHNHQPIGNFGFVFENAYNQAYLPFLEVIEKHPGIKMAFHFSGPLIDWIDENHPEFFDRLAELVANGQIEMMTGAYYEPILPIIPDEDKIGQIKKLTEYIKRRFDYDAIGMWVAERVWEPHLPKPINQAGVKYTVIDDNHFKFAGLTEEETFGFYASEELNYAINIFPISEKLRYTIPFRQVKETIDYLRDISTEDGKRIVVMADDGEKYGVWPHTHEHCYTKGWLNEFFSALEDNSSWINIITFKDAISNFAPIGRIYLPTASYREMMEWVLPPQFNHTYEELKEELQQLKLYEKIKPFFKGGFWRNYFPKYPEVNHFHKKMLRISNRLNGLDDNLKKDKTFIEARNYLWKAQCNCAYWHGIFGGLYLNHLRYAVYNNLIKCEQLIDKIVQKNEDFINLEVIDFDSDGYDEIIIENKSQNLYISPRLGGSLIEFDIKKAGFNLIDTLSRKEEAYHILAKTAKLSSDQEETATIHSEIKAKERGLEQLLDYDWYRRSCFLDHFMNLSATLTDFKRAKYPEDGDFVNQPYSYEIKKKKDGYQLRLHRDGALYRPDSVFPISVTKIIIVNKEDRNILPVSYLIKNNSGKKVETIFGVEFNINLLAGNAEDRYYNVPGIQLENKKLNSIGEIENIKEFYLVDEWQKIVVKLIVDKEAKFWRFPNETVSLSEDGLEKAYQGSVILPHWNLALQPEEEFTVTITLSIESKK